MFLERKKSCHHLNECTKRKASKWLWYTADSGLGKQRCYITLLRNKKALYLPAEEVNDSLNLQKFSRLLVREAGNQAFFDA